MPTPNADRFKAIDGGSFCICSHTSDEHGRKRCTGRDSYGFRCECDEFELDLNTLDEEDDEFEPEADPNDFIQMRSVSRAEEFMHGTICTDYYADKARKA